MSKKHLSELTVLIDRFSQKGFGAGMADKEGSTARHKVEVPFAVPGDMARVSVGRKRKGSYRGRLQEIVTSSPLRVEPRCTHASSCGGCAWQQLSYEEQCKVKDLQVKGLFHSVKDENTSLHPLIPCESPWEYRNKMEYTFSQNKAGDRFLGLIMAASKGKVISLTECHLTPPWFCKTLQQVRDWWERSDLSAYHRNDNIGSLRTLTLRQGLRTGHKMALLTVSGEPAYALKKEHLQGFVEAICSTLKEEEKGDASIFLQIHQIIPGSPSQFYEMLLFGRDHIREELQISTSVGLKKYQFKISPTAFFQPNTQQAENLYSRALAMAGQRKYKHVLDLYAGTATLGIIFSSIAEKVTAIELNPHAVFDASINKEWNCVRNLDIHRGDVFQVLEGLSQKEDFVRPDLVIVDPPRAGLEPKALAHLMRLSPPTIIYISCNPRTQAENGLQLKAAGYCLKEVQPIDQFPHTVHIENLTLWQKEK